jgi:TIR domain
MAYVRGAVHDIFVSYAHLDNLAPAGGGHGWVDSFAELLTIQLKKRLGSGAVDLWIDRELAGNRPLTPEILRAVRESALLLVVMSPAYLQSQWCGRERSTFLDVAAGRVATGRVFLVRCLDEPISDRPEEFRDLHGYEFFVADPDTGVPRSLGDPNPAESEFLRRIYGLSYHLAEELKRLNTTTSSSSAASDAPAGPRVFVARATDDLEDREEELRNFLRQAGIGTSLRRQYVQADAESFENAMRAELETSKLFVQLLSQVRGPETAFGGDKRLPVLQWEVAQRAGKKLLLWRDRTVDVTGVSSAGHRMLLESAIACPIEEFKRTVAEEVRREPPPPLQRRSNVMVFVDSESRDQTLSRDLGRMLASHGVACYWPLDSGSPEEVRKDLEANLRDCDGVVIVYGASEPSWVREKVRFGTKVFRQRPNRPTLAICQGPPPDKGELGLLDPDMLLLDCSGGLAVDALRPFVERLQL